MKNFLTVSTVCLALSIVADSAIAQTATAGDAGRYVPHGSRTHEIQRNNRGFQPNTIRPIQPTPPAPAQAANRGIGFLAKQGAKKAGTYIAGAGATALGIASSKVIIVGTVVVGGAWLTYDLIAGD